MRCLATLATIATHDTILDGSHHISDVPSIELDRSLYCGICGYWSVSEESLYPDVERTNVFVERRKGS